MFMYLQKNKKGFTLIELMVVVAIIGILALLGLRVYSGQQEKARIAIVKGNAGTIQTLIQSELADRSAEAVWGVSGAGIAALIDDSGIHNPIENEKQQENGTKAGEVVVTYGTGITDEDVDEDNVFYINGITKDAGNVYDTSLTARR